MDLADKARRRYQEVLDEHAQKALAESEQSTSPGNETGPQPQEEDHETGCADGTCSSAVGSEATFSEGDLEQSAIGNF